MTNDKDAKQGNGKPMPNSSAPARRRNPKDTHQKSEWIGKQLRDFYGETLSEPVPDRFVELLRELDKRAGKTE